MINEDSDMNAHTLGDVSPRTANRIEAKNSAKNKNKTTATGFVADEDIAALERELKEIKGLGDDSPRIAKHLEAMEAVIVRMKNSVKDVDEGTTGLLRAGDDKENANRNNVQGFLNRLIESTSMIFGCLGTPREVNHRITGENTAANIDGSEKCFMEWLNHHQLNQSNEDWKSVLTRLKDGAIQKGTRLSHLLLDFLFLVSEGGDNVEIFEVFRDTLESRIPEDDKNLVAAKRVFVLLEMVEKEVRNLKNRGESSLPEKIRKDLVGQRKRFFDQLACYFCWQIESLDTFLTRLLLTKSALVKTMEEGFFECDAQLNRIEQEINNQRLLEPFSVEEDSEAIEVLKTQLKFEIRQMWSRIG